VGNLVPQREREREREEREERERDLRGSVCVFVDGWVKERMSEKERQN